MPRFQYTARGIGQETLQGFLDAENEESAAENLQKQGLFPIQIVLESKDAFTGKAFGHQKIKRRDFTLFIRQLYDMISSGISLLSSLELVESQVQNRAFKQILQQIISGVRGGQKFSETLKMYPAVFSNFFVNLVRSGEASGSLDQVLMRLADFSDNQEEIRTKVKAALAYPVFVCTVGLGVIVVLLTFVVPRMSGIFEDLGQELPLLTKILVNLSQGVRVFWWVFAAIFIAMIFVLRISAVRQEMIRFWEKTVIRLPLFGVIQRDREIGRFARTLSMLLSNGVPLIQALEICEETLGNLIFRGEIKDLIAGLRRGERMRDRLKRSKFLPLNVINMIAVGEETGQLERSLNRIADSYEKTLDRDVKMATSLMEPVMILIIGGLVGLIAMAMLLPIFKINFLIR
jgi:general secretion pathway protein F